MRLDDSHASPAAACIFPYHAVLMFGYRLKINIAVHTALVLVVAMVLIGLVMLINLRNMLVHAEIVRGRLVAGMLQDYAELAGGGADYLFNRKFIESLHNVLRQGGYACALVLGPDGRRLSFGNRGCPGSAGAAAAVRRVMRSLKTTANLHGSTWGVVWKQPRELLIAAPFMHAGQVVGGIGFVRDLDGVYARIRKTHPRLAAYLLINTLFLTLFGVYKLSKLTVRPLQRIVQRAEAAGEVDDDMFFLPDSGSNEFTRLSQALNRMLQRIEQNRHKLRESVASLEKANADLRRMQREIVRAEKLAAAGRLSAGIAHEIGNPIGIAMGYLELLSQPELPDEERRACIEKAAGELARIDAIIRQLLDFSRPSGTVDAQEVSVHALIEELADIFRLQPLTADIELVLDLKADKDRVKADTGQLRQVFLNLMINAADAIHAAAGDDGRLSVASRLADERTDTGRRMIELRFCDNGSGISPEHIDNIFDPFFTTKAPGRGTGLGLSVSIMLIESMGGRIEVQSRLQEGTTLQVFLPLAQTGRKAQEGRYGAET